MLNIFTKHKSIWECLWQSAGVKISGVVVREITHATAQNMHECLACKTRSGGERNGRLGRSNSHPPDRELCLASGLPMHWRACKLPHCVIDPDVAFWYHYLSPA